MELSEQDRLSLERLEEALWREETGFDAERMNELMAPDFFEFGRSGRRYGREDILSVQRQRIDAAFPLGDSRRGCWTSMLRKSLTTAP